MNEALIEEAREWLSDCQWADVDAEDIYAMSPEVIEDAVERLYAGGVAEFVAMS